MRQQNAIIGWMDEAPAQAWLFADPHVGHRNTASVALLRKRSRRMRRRADGDCLASGRPRTGRAPSSCSHTPRSPRVAPSSDCCCTLDASSPTRAPCALRALGRETSRVKSCAVFLIISLRLMDSAIAAAPMMRAAVIASGSVQIESVPTPVPAMGQVRIKVRAASVNPVDWKIADHAAPGSRQIAGRDLSGVIDAIGPDVDRWKPGDSVIAVASGGSYAEYALASVAAIARKPEHMPFDEAAGIPIVGETAWRAVVTVADVQQGQRVLIHGGAGGVGSSAVQIAKARGAYVIATASPRNNDFLRSIGADEVIDYSSVPFEDKVKNLDMVLNTVDADTGSRSVGVIKPGGILVSIVGPPPAGPCDAARIRCATTGMVTGEMLGQVAALASAGKFHVSIDRRLPLAQFATAWNTNRKGHTRGTIILLISP
jgi:NADPH:quinone reductase-like Zn-dependent oxidoreductase